MCSNEAKSVAFTILPKNLGHINLTVVAKNIDSSVCKKDVKQVTLGITDAVSRKLLVEVMSESLLLYFSMPEFLHVGVRMHICDWFRYSS